MVRATGAAGEKSKNSLTTILSFSIRRNTAGPFPAPGVAPVPRTAPYLAVLSLFMPLELSLPMPLELSLLVPLELDLLFDDLLFDLLVWLVWVL